MEHRAMVKYMTKDLLDRVTGLAAPASVVELNLSSAEDTYHITVCCCNGVLNLPHSTIFILI
jgi:hypothetical protein